MIALRLRDRLRVKVYGRGEVGGLVGALAGGVYRPEKIYRHLLENFFALDPAAAKTAGYRWLAEEVPPGLALFRAFRVVFGMYSSVLRGVESVLGRFTATALET